MNDRVEWQEMSHYPGLTPDQIGRCLHTKPQLFLSCTPASSIKELTQKVKTKLVD